MTNFESEQLYILCGAWEITAQLKETAEAKGMRRCARELRDHLRHADTLPPPVPSTPPPDSDADPA